ncbi:MAG: PAS domain S-box protein [Spirochaetota bacterium]
MIYIDLTYNLTLLITLSTISGFIENRWSRNSRPGILLQGLLFGGAALLGMLWSWHLTPGIFVDGRSVVISLCALFFGPFAAALSCAIAIIYRIWTGGAGMITGIFLILLSGIIGALTRFYIKPEVKYISSKNLYLFGLIVHIATLATMFTLPGGTGSDVLARIGPPVILLFPLATVLTGKILYKHIESRDISKALHNSEERYRLIAENISDTIGEFDLDLNAKYISPSVLKLRGYSAQEVMTQTLDQMLTPESAQKVRKKLLEQLAMENAGNAEQSGNVILELEEYCKDGSTIWVELSALFLRDTNKKPTGILSVTRDITARKRAAEKIIESEAKYRTVVESSLVGVYIIQDNLLRFVNKRWCIIYGYSTEEIINKISPLDLTPPEEKNKVAENIKKRLSGEIDSIEYETKAIRKDGRIINIRVMGSVVLYNGRPAISGTVINITERKQAEENLKESERRFATLINNLPGLVYRCKNDLNWTMEYLSDRCEELTGYLPEDLLNNTVLSYNDLIHPEDRKQVYDSVQNHINIKQSYQMTYRIKTAQETVKWVWEKGTGVFNETGELMALEGFIADISERKQAQEALVESEGKYRILVESVLVGVYVIQDNLFRFVNKRFCEIYGYSYDEIVDKLSPVDITYANDTGIVTENLRKRISGEIDSISYTIRGVRKDGEIRMIEIFGGVSTYNGRRAILGTIIDVTERKHAEEALKEKEEFLSSIVENIPDMIFIKDARELRFIRFNKAGENLLGYKREELIGRNDYDFFPADQADFFTKKDMEVLKSGQLYDIPEEPIDTKSGKKILHTQKIPIPDKNGNPAYLLGISEDITDRKQSEKEQERLQSQLLQAQKMESIGRLAGGVAHDFNNMLSVITGYTELITSEIDPSQPIFGRLQEIRKAAQRSAELTRQLLAFARKQTISPRILNINETIENILKILRRLIGEDIDLVWIPGIHVRPIKIDPAQIDQILTNLCINARDAIAGVGKVTIATQPISINELFCDTHPDFSPGEFILLTVSDNGRGMEKDILDKLFEPFFTTKDRGKGTGLGLATVYGIVKQNNGLINVYSEPGHGTIFKIYLPCIKEDIEILREELVSQIPHGNETLLLVEDEPLTLKMTREMLESLGYQVLAARNPGDAIKIATEYSSKIQLLVTDVIMPDMNGKDLKIKLSLICPKLKCLFTSGYTSDIIAHQGVLDDGVNFIQKPFSIHDIAAKIREILDKD